MSDSTTRTARTLDVLEALCGFAANGASNKDLCAATQSSPTQITNCMADLVAKGWARKSEEAGRFYPTAQFTRLTFRVLSDFERSETKLQDLKRSMTS